MSDSSSRVRRLLPTPSDALDAGALVEHYRPPHAEWLRANMVSTADGAAAGGDGLSASISSAADKAVFSVLRAWSDAVLVAAGTAREERYTRLCIKSAYRDARTTRGQRPFPTLAIVSRSADLDFDHLTSVDGGELRLYTTHDADGLDAAGRALAPEELRLADEEWSVEDVLADLRADGHGVVQCEGGPSYLSQVAAAGALDELCVTLTPRLAGGDAGRIVAGAELAQPLRLEGLLESDSTLMARYVRD